MPDIRRQRRRLAAARDLLLAQLPAVVLAVLLWEVLPVAASTTPRRWDHGAVRYYDATGMRESVITAAARWNASGARVRLREARSRRDADVVLEVDDRRLRSVCGHDCLGFTTSIGGPARGRSTVLLDSDLEGITRPLSVWVVAHELGHVLGLEHHDGRACSLMSPHAFDTRCAPSLAVARPTLAQLACVPAPADVDAAARLYGGAAAFRDPRCR